MTRDGKSKTWRSAAQVLIGGLGLLLATFMCSRLGLNLATTSYVNLILIALLSLMGSLIGLAILSIIAVGLLDYFFAPPLFSVRVQDPQDVLALSTFLIISVIITILAEKTRKAAEDARAAQRALADAIPALVWSALPDGSRDFHSRRWLEFTGLSAAAASGEGWAAAVHPDDRAAFVDNWRRAVITGEPLELEARLRSVNGDYRWFVVCARPLRNESGTIVKWYGSNVDIDDRKRATDALRSNEAQWREVFEHNRMYFIVDPAGTVLLVNKFGAAQLGYTVTELVGQSVLKVFFEEDWEFVLRNIAACLETLGQSKSWEVRKLRKDGTLLWVRENAKAVRRSDNQLIVLVAGEDVTERYKVGVELARLGSIVASSDDAIISKDSYDRITSWNAGATHILGYQTSEMIGEPITRIIPPELHAEEAAIFGRLLRGERIPTYETVRVAKDGRRINMAITVSPMFDKSGKVIGASKVGRDITDRKQAEDALRRSETSLAEAQKVAHIGTFRRHITTGEMFWSEEVFRIYGLEPHEGPAVQRALERTHPDDLPRVQQYHERLSQGEGDWEIEYRLLMPDGAVKHLHAVSRTTTDASGNLESIGAVMDITTMRQAEQELNQLRTELERVARVTTLGELTAAIAHEVNQPLTGLVSSGNACLNWLSSEPPNLEAARKSVQRMIKNGERAGEVIGRIRAMVSKSRPQRGHLNINDAIIEVIAMIRPEVQNNRIALRTELSNDVPLIVGDRIQLQQVVLNLLINAIDAMSEIESEPRELLVASVKNGSNGVVVEVRDSGHGLDKMALDRLFQAFYTTKVNGIGIGLAISRTIIESHGGLLWAEPNMPRGAVFKFKLPTDGDEAALS